MGYDVQFVRIADAKALSLPIPAERAGTVLAAAQPFDAPDTIRRKLLEYPGCRPGRTSDSVEFLGRGMSYARLITRTDSVHIENDASVRDIIGIFEHLQTICPDLLIRDLQNQQLHDAQSFQEWWAKPL